VVIDPEILPIASPQIITVQGSNGPPDGYMAYRRSELEAAPIPRIIHPKAYASLPDPPDPEGSPSHTANHIGLQ